MLLNLEDHLSMGTKIAPRYGGGVVQISYCPIQDAFHIEIEFLDLERIVSKESVSFL